MTSADIAAAELIQLQREATTLEAEIRKCAADSQLVIAEYYRKRRLLYRMRNIVLYAIGYTLLVLIFIYLVLPRLLTSFLSPMQLLRTRAILELILKRQL